VAKRDPAVTSRIMSRIRSKNTKAEIALAKAMWGLGLRYRKHYRIEGKPDFVFVGPKVAVFCDGDFWHGRDFEARLEAGRFQNNTEYWINKILRNRNRDATVNAKLEAAGWLVIRIWESDILADPLSHAERIRDILRRRKV
jgi:DNA mismatch endonuclease, patch repair protein